MTDAAFEATVEGLGAEGDGVVTHDGRCFFVALTAPGDRALCRPLEGCVGPARAEAVSVLREGPDRADPPCRHYAQCGGCILQHVSEDFVAGWKRLLVAEGLNRQGLRGVDVEPVLTSPAMSRRRAEFTALRGKRGVVLGFNARRSRAVFDVGECPVARPEITCLVAPLRSLLPGFMKPRERLDVLVTSTDSGVDVLFTGSMVLGPDGREALAVFAEARDVARLAWRRDRHDAPEALIVRRPVVQDFSGLAVGLPPGAFLQATKEGEAALVGLACEALAGRSRIADLFAGCGTFSAALAAEGARIEAFDASPDMAGELQRASSRAGRTISATARDLFRDPLTPGELAGFDAVLFDPPRQGAKAQATAIAESGVPMVVAVSCQPSTFARDVRMLVDGGYAVRRVVPVDQFRYSGHVEIIAVLERLDGAQAKGRR